MWNCSANLQDGVGKTSLMTLSRNHGANYQDKCSQVANATDVNVQKAALTTQIQKELKKNLRSLSEKKKVGSKRHVVIKTSDMFLS